LKPVISVAILNYQRRDALRRALRAVGTQKLDQPWEVIAVDNASTDGSADMVRAEFPQVRVVELAENMGAAGRNAGVEAARGPIVVTLDNDVLLTSPDDLARVLDVFAHSPRAAVVSFMILGPGGTLSRRDWCHPRDPDAWSEREFLTDSVLEGASACRRNAFLAAGGYWKPFFIGHEGWDLGLRLINAGWEVHYTPTVRVHHLVESSVRPSSRIYYTFTRNAIWVALRNHGPAAAVASIARDLSLMAFTAARAGHLGAYARGVRDGIVGARRALATRQTLTGPARRRLRRIRALEPGVVARARRHLRERLI
jgi:GT2 family glycosyltransferase